MPIFEVLHYRQLFEQNMQIYRDPNTYGKYLIRLSKQFILVLYLPDVLSLLYVPYFYSTKYRYIIDYFSEMRRNVVVILDEILAHILQRSAQPKPDRYSENQILIYDCTIAQNE